MLKYLVSILLLSVVLACNKPVPSAKPDYYYVLKGDENNMYDIRDSTKLIGKAYYGTYNFILSGDTGIYLHTRFIKGWMCGTGRELIDNTKPEYIRLIPDSIKRFTVCSLDKYLSQIFVPWGNFISSKPRIVVSIVSTADTIRNPGYAIIKNRIENAPLKEDLQIIWTLRKPTEQERVALSYKFNNKHFNIDSIHWQEQFDTHNIPPPPPLPKGVKFTNP